MLSDSAYPKTLQLISGIEIAARQHVLFGSDEVLTAIINQTITMDT